MERTFAVASDDWNERLHSSSSSGAAALSIGGAVSSGSIGFEDGMMSPARSRARSSSSAAGMLASQQHLNLQSSEQIRTSSAATVAGAAASGTPAIEVDIDDHDNLGDDRIKPALLRSLLNARPDLAMLLYECICDEGLAEMSDQEGSDQEDSEVHEY